MNFINPHRYGTGPTAPTAFLYDDVAAAYSLRRLPFTTTWTEPLVYVIGQNGYTDIYPDASGTISDTSLTTGGVSFSTWNSGGQKPVSIFKWYSQNNLNTIDTSKNMQSTVRSETPVIWTYADGFNLVNSEIAASFSSNQKLQTTSPITEITDVVDATISTVTSNGLTSSNGNFLNTDLSNSLSLKMYNNTNGTLTVKNTSLSLDIDYPNYVFTQKYLAYTKNGSSHKLYNRGYLIDSGTNSNYFYNGNLQFGNGFVGNIQEVVIFDTHYSSLIDLSNEVNTHYQVPYIYF